MNKRMQRLLIIEGADKNWKTTIAKNLAQVYDIPYFKHHGEKQAHITHGGKGAYFQNLLHWSQPFFVDFLKQSRVSALFDRAYPSEFVYTRVFDREFDEEVWRRVDAEWAKLEAVIIILYRTDLSKLNDRDEFAHIEENLKEINKHYEEFAIAQESVCTILPYDVSEFADSEVLTLEIIKDLMEMGF